jgi:hypothetical protein
MENRNVQLEAEMLTNRFRSVKNRAAFARDYCVPGGQTMINQNMKGLKPISRTGAIAYAKGFGCSIEEISPYWARELSATPAGIIKRESKDEKQNAPTLEFRSKEPNADKARSGLTGLQRQLIELTDGLDDIGIAILIGHARQIAIQYAVDVEKKRQN